MNNDKAKKPIATPISISINTYTFIVEKNITSTGIDMNKANGRINVKNDLMNPGNIDIGYLV